MRLLSEHLHVRGRSKPDHWFRHVSRVATGLSALLLASTVGAVGPSGQRVDVDSFAVERLASSLDPAPPEAEAAGVVPKAGGVDQRVLGFNEPTVALNPLEPDNLAVADVGLMRVSTDRGGSFGPFWFDIPLPGFEPAGDPSLAFDSRGRMFWSFLGRSANGRLDVFISQRDPSTGAELPGYPVNVSEAAGVGSRTFHDNDKEWIAADANPDSPFRDRLYVVWTDFSPLVVWFTWSDDQGLTWSPALQLSSADLFPWPVHVAVGSDGAVYVAWHDDPDEGFGRIVLLRSEDGGTSFPLRSEPFPRGLADITFNEQFGFRRLHGSRSWTQGSAQPWILPDPARRGNVYVVAADDPTDFLHGAGFDDMNVYIARSSDRGQSWDAPQQIDLGPVGTTQFFPTAGIAADDGCLVVAWWDMRGGLTNAEGNFLLDLLIRSSSDGGISFGPERQINDVPFDPDLGAPDRFPPSRTLRIGEYNGVAVADGTAHFVWTGNVDAVQSPYYDNAPACEPEPLPVDVDIKPGSCPNPWNPGSRGVLPLALLGSETFDVGQVDVASVVLSRADGIGGSVGASVGPQGLRAHVQDVGAPFEGEGCACQQLAADGRPDLALGFDTAEAAAALALAELPPGELTELVVSGRLLDGTPFEGSDCVRLVPARKPAGRP